MNNTPNTVELRFQVSDLKVEQRNDEQGGGRLISGYAAKFDTWSTTICGWFREKIERQAFAECDMSDVIACFNHIAESILARTSSGTLSLLVDNVGLAFSFEAPNTTTGNDMLELIRRGDIDKCSFKFIVGEDRWIYADAANGLECDERTILKFKKLIDISLVTHPAYDDTEASVRSAGVPQSYLDERKRRDVPDTKMFSERLKHLKLHIQL